MKQRTAERDGQGTSTPRSGEVGAAGRRQALWRATLALVVTAVVLGVLLHVPSVPRADAQPFRTESACGASATYHQHVKVPASGGHYADVSSHICHNGSIVKWASQPAVTFPSYRVAGIPAPQAALETLSASRPVIYSYKKGLGGNQRITWRFTVTVKAIRGAIPIATETYYFRTYPAYLELEGHGNRARSAWTAD